jgi:hypothetical protein
MSNTIVRALVGCAVISALGGFGAPLFCGGRGAECTDQWRQASMGALAASASLGTLLARPPGGPGAEP